MIGMEFFDVYRPWRGAKLAAESRVIFSVWFLVIIGLLFLAWSFKVSSLYSRLVIGLWFVCAPLGIVCVHLVTRVVLRLFRKHGRNSRTAVIVGAGDLGRRLTERISEATWSGIQLQGFFDDDSRKKGGSVLGKRVLGGLDDVTRYVQEHSIDYVYIALPMRAETQMREVFDALQDTTASVLLVPDVFVFELFHARYQDIAGIPVIFLCETPLTGPYGLVKKMEDMLCINSGPCLFVMMVLRSVRPRKGIVG
jgi:putative colanic acid biosynthesis UDP-glucose lipid carrier transferase